MSDRVRIKEEWGGGAYTKRAPAFSEATAAQVLQANGEVTRLARETCSQCHHCCTEVAISPCRRAVQCDTRGRQYTVRGGRLLTAACAIGGGARKRLQEVDDIIWDAFHVTENIIVIFAHPSPLHYSTTQRGGRESLRISYR